jgi:hypothetical protein
MEILQKLKKRTATWFSNHSSEHKSKGNEVWMSKDSSILMSTVASFTIGKIQKQPKCPWMDTENVVYIHSEILFSLKVGNPVTWKNKCVLRGHDVKWNKPDTDKICITSLTCGV